MRFSQGISSKSVKRLCVGKCDKTNNQSGSNDSVLTGTALIFYDGDRCNLTPVIGFVAMGG
ncbi:hypothetical protein, partial [Brucella neotomae]|uniref:hypothetical protein n=1 Tax=Brucella neotomae TaxID=29460 RepID=UPI0005B3B80A